MKLSIPATLTLAFSPVVLGTVGPFPIVNQRESVPVACHTGPGETHHISRLYKHGDLVNVTCQYARENVNRVNIWSNTTDDCWVSNYYLDTNVIREYMFVADLCDEADVPERPNYGAGLIFDDYPYRGACDGVDDWNYYQCQCTSFVAWRINDRLKVNFHSNYKNKNWGFADTWIATAKRAGVLVDNKPKPGAIAHTKYGDSCSHHGPNAGWVGGDHGRVSWVAAFNDSVVIIEEYNYHRRDRQERGLYSWRALDSGLFMYIHFDAPISRPEWHEGYEGYNITEVNGLI